MAKLPVVSGEEAIQVFEYFGYERVRQKGSHVRLKRPGHTSISVPLRSALKRGLLRGLIRDAGLTVEQLVEKLEGS